MKQYKVVSKFEALNTFSRVLTKGLKRPLTEQELRTIVWLSDCEYETVGVITDLFKELVENIEKERNIDED